MNRLNYLLIFLIFLTSCDSNSQKEQEKGQNNKEEILNNQRTTANRLSKNLFHYKDLKTVQIDSIVDESKLHELDTKQRSSLSDFLVPKPLASTGAYNAWFVSIYNKIHGFTPMTILIDPDHGKRCFLATVDSTMKIIDFNQIAYKWTDVIDQVEEYEIIGTTEIKSHFLNDSTFQKIETYTKAFYEKNEIISIDSIKYKYSILRSGKIQLLNKESTSYKL